MSVADVAVRRAREDSRAPASTAPRAPVSRMRRLAIGDPQASAPRFFDILDRHGVLTPDGRLIDDVHLVSIGDHFDWGAPTQRSEAAADGLAILAWLAAHPPDQVTILLGNHDLARVGEVAAFDEATFAQAQAEADALYFDASGKRREIDPEAEAGFRERYPALPGVEAASRDLSTFRVSQRELVRALLGARRLSLATAAGSALLLCHAGVTVEDLERLGLNASEQASAPAVAGALNAALDEAFGRWDGLSAFAIPGLHQPGSARAGEARGILVNRPGKPGLKKKGRPGGAQDYEGPLRRRYDPRSLPVGLTQAIGHIRDDKARRLLGSWVDGEPGSLGSLRHLRVRGKRVRYAAGVPKERTGDGATLVFIDGSMRDADPARYELLDLDRLAPAERPT